MRVALITNLNGIGLQRDFELLRDYLESLGHSVTGLQYDAPLPDPLPSFDLALFLETVPPNMMKLAPINWLFANCEWMKPEVIKLADRHFDRIFAKTQEGYRLLAPLFGDRVVYTGFMARDNYDPSIPRENRFLHIGGNSAIRGTTAVRDAWLWKHNGEPIGAELTIVSRVLKERPEIPRVTYLERVSDEEIKRLQNSHRFHIYPSATEGFGHSLHESQGVGAFVLTTSAPPMNELPDALLIPAKKSGKYNLADLYEVSALDIHELVKESYKFAVTCPGLLAECQEDTRSKFLSANDDFKMRFAEQLADLEKRGKKARPTRVRSGKNILFLGNFQNVESTENMIRWALEERLGYEVEALQENETNLRALEDASEFNDFFLWVRTPTWLKVPDSEMFAFLDSLRARKIPSFGVHLDKFWGIPEREKLIGKIPFWKLQYLFTADGSRQEDFKKFGINHIWMPAAASEVYSHRGCPRENFRCDVAFVGARGYHQEHQFRTVLIEFLEQTYGDRFKLVEGIRGHDLNDFYASCRVCIGDCFGGGKIPFYFSDRMVETPMRYGFLLSPEIEGLNIPLATFRPEDLLDLHEKIEYWLSHENERRAKVIECAEYARRFDTWTERLRSVLGTIHDESTESAGTD
jgi:hypothetical protein